MKMFRMLVAVVAISLATCSTASAIPIANAGFEANGPGVALIPTDWTIGAGAFPEPEIVAAGGLPLGTIGIFANGAPASPNGGNFLLGSLGNGGESVSQVSTVVGGLNIGATYKVSFYQTNGGFEDFRALPDQTGSGNWDVTLDSAPTQSSPTMVFQGFGSQTWSLIEMEFVPTTTTASLTFHATGGTSGRLGLDGISVEEQIFPTTPEPSAIILTVIGLLGVCASGRRRRRNMRV